MAEPNDPNTMGVRHEDYIQRYHSRDLDTLADGEEKRSVRPDIRPRNKLYRKGTWA